MTVQIHDTKRCPECDQLGTIDELDTRTGGDSISPSKRTKKRIYKCADCNVRWEYYV